MNRFSKRVSSLKKIYEKQESVGFNTRRVSSKEEKLLLEAKKLHGHIYLQRAFIDRKDLDRQGVIHVKADPHQEHSDYFVVVDDKDPNKVLGTARQIRAVNGHDDLPVLVQARVSKRGRKGVLEVSPEHCIEISGLAKAKGVPTEAMLELYKAMWLHSMDQGHRMWLMACDVRLYKRLRILFGSSISRIGRRTAYKGGDIIPCVLDLSKSSLHLQKNLKNKHPVYGSIRRRVARNFLQVSKTKK